MKVYCGGHDDFFEIGADDLVEFPKGMKITWHVIEAVKKHYNLDTGGSYIVVGISIIRHD